ncbi:glutamyl-tRNA reductase [Pelagicoccus mobilis]|uniref:Glutamyl-tRNA reductase n=1 Tax=Pelagicoccus mobilis TaxID=415221 RepID=A0A934VTU0_9BACT|nr:glutamyl-tRNA reductase [Pelagicoccus mobilis]MBK1880073.1 glutamyl-tRNA reductase [Pelagicoccus mobilis]
MSQGNDSFFVLSINHEKAPLEVREKYSLDSAKVGQLYDELDNRPSVSESLILNTCNRFELYTRLQQGASSNEVLDLLASFYGTTADDVSEHLHLDSGQQAVQHLIEVSAGLRSQITGEAEILGQVKTAYATSQEAGHAGKVINRVFQKAFQAAKLIRTSTAVCQGQISIASVAVDLATKIFGNLSSAAALSIGTGEIGENTVASLRARGARQFAIASRSSERAREAAEQWGGTPKVLGELESYLADYDIVIAAVGSEEPVVTRQLLKTCGIQKRERPLFLIDLGLPRNIEQSCEDFDNVFLYNLDDLANIAEENLAHRKEAVVESKEIAAQKSQFIWNAILKRQNFLR